MGHASAVLLSTCLAMVGGPAVAEDAVGVRLVLIPQAGASPTALETVLGDQSLRHFRRDASLGPGLAACLSAWRDRSAQARACVQSRLQSEREGPAVAVSILRRRQSGTTDIECIGSGGFGTTEIGRRSGDAARLHACITNAATARSSPATGRAYAIHSGPLLPGRDRQGVIARAPGWLTMAVDHAGHPRGYAGRCHLSGRVHAVHRGAGLSRRGLIEFSVPCSVDGGDRGNGGTVAMSTIAAGTFVDVYFDRNHQVVGLRLSQ